MVWRWQPLLTQAGAMAAGLSPGTTSHSGIKPEAEVQAKKSPDVLFFLGWTRRKSQLWVPGVTARDASHGSSLTVRGRRSWGKGLGVWGNWVTGVLRVEK